MGTWSLNPLVWFDRARDGSAACAYVGMLHWSLLAIALVAMVFDHRELMGVNIWLKPAKFLISAAIYLWTIGWLLNYVDASILARSSLGTLASLIMLLENVAVVGQAIRGERSHFNLSTPLNGAIFSIMGIMIAVNTILLIVLLWWFFAKAAPMPAGALWGCRLGVLLAVLSSFEGAYMAQALAHTVGLKDGGPGVPFLNWSTQAGDLRISHFIGLHGLQVLPLGGFLLSEFGASAGVFILALFHYGAFVLTLLQALAKKPLLF
ncbi:MAG: hypothetical protein FJW36_13975 [Acidobacteria bacterium]|nr:hypothetical protein [Acidobacteriota bacterium]